VVLVIKIIRIETCKDCPYYSEAKISVSESSHNCHYPNRQFRRIYNEDKRRNVWSGKVPDWCQLEEFNNNVE
jgi:hypothetical protein